MPLPTFLIIGAPRAATTAVHQWLGSHPDVCVSRPKETQFFSLHYGQGPSYYDGFFAHHRGERVIGESTPVYLTLPYVPNRIAATLPDAALITILREPVEQAYSTWWMFRCLGVERRTFEDAVAAELADGPLEEAGAEAYWRDLLEASARGRRTDAGRYLMTGHYVDALSRYFECFDRRRLTVLLHDDLVAAPEASMRRIANAVGIDVDRSSMPRPARVNQSTGRIESAVARRVRGIPSARARKALARIAGRLDRSARPPLADATRSDLIRYFATINEGLASLIGADVSSWFEAVDV